MYELVLIACLLGQPATCEKVHLPFQQPLPMLACMFQAQFRMAEWAQTRPGWTVREWHCELPQA